MPLSDYLAKNYLSADKPSKKRKRKTVPSNGLTIAEDDTNAWNKPAQASDDEDGPLVVPSSSSHKTTTWKTFGVTAPTNAEAAAAERILADASAERAREAQDADADDGPAIVDADESYGIDVGDGGGPAMSSGAKAGLQTAAQISAQLAKKEREEKRRMAEEGLDDPAGKAQETIYRDASGRVINVAMKRAELRRKAEEDERRKIAAEEADRGEVQRLEKEARKAELEGAKYLSVARYADDKELNEEMKEKERWNDPAMRFLSTTTGTGRSAKGARAKKTYQGASEPNRYGIKPGYRWDGVDRSNGFERKWFQARNAKQSRKEAEYAWEMDE
ncbi:hypothetical protein MBLNU457_6084t1 [Dothideomycetes sp. NU457]